MKKPAYLSQNGLFIFEQLKKHCEQKLKMFDVDDFELAMLANSFDLYSSCAKFCLDYGVSMTFAAKDGKPNYDDEDIELDDDEKNTNKAKGGQYQQIRPEYTVMKNEYQNILKHGAKFGLNPGDRAKIFKGLMKDDGKDKKKGFDLTMKIAK